MYFLAPAPRWDAWSSESGAAIRTVPTAMQSTPKQSDLRSISSPRIYAERLRRTPNRFTPQTGDQDINQPDGKYFGEQPHVFSRLGAVASFCSRERHVRLSSETRRIAEMHSAGVGAEENHSSPGGIRTGEWQAIAGTLVPGFGLRAATSELDASLWLAAPAAYKLRVPTGPRAQRPIRGD